MTVTLRPCRSSSRDKCGISRCLASRKTIPLRHMILVLPGFTVAVISHDLIAQKNLAAIAISAMIDSRESFLGLVSAPDCSNIARRSWGVAAFCFRFGWSMLSQALSQALTDGRMFVDSLKCRGLTPIWLRNDVKSSLRLFAEYSQPLVRDNLLKVCPWRPTRNSGRS